MKCPQCKNPTEISFDRECEWCGHIIPLSSRQGTSDYHGGDPIQELQKALLDAENAIRDAHLRQSKVTKGNDWSGLLHRAMDSFQSGVFSGSMNLENNINQAKASIVGTVILPQDRPSLQRMLDLAEAQTAATKVKWWNSNANTEGEEALHKAWEGLTMRLNKALSRGNT